MQKKVVVIGGGLAGSLICNELAKNADVTLLEIGHENSIHYPPIGIDNKVLAQVNTFCFGGGGTTNLWHNGLIPINRNDVLNPEFADVIDELQPFTDKAASALFFKNEPFSVVYENLLDKMSDLAGTIGFTQNSVDCLIYPKQYSRLTVHPTVHQYYSVDKIGFVFEGKRVKTVNFSTGSRSHAIDCDTVIVSAGTLGSPKVLRDLINDSGNHHDSLGVGFIDHPLGFIGKVRFNREISKQINKLSFYDGGDFACRTAIRLVSDCGNYACCAFLRPALTMDNNLSIYKYKSLLGASSGFKRIQNALSWKILHPDIIAEIFSHLFGVGIQSRTFNILFIGEQKRSKNKVYYDGDNLRVNWSISPEELSIYRSLLIKLGDMLQNIAEQVNIQTDITDDWLWSAAHHSGTTSLGSADEDLIDKDLKVKYCDNVFVCDGSVIQEHSYANTGLTIGQLALRLAKKVLDDSDR